jgi:hypothetical protein
MGKSWLGISSIKTNEWTSNRSIEEWWLDMSCKALPNRRAMATFTMLVRWTIWKERNTRYFNNKAAPMTVLLEIIKSEARL